MNKSKYLLITKIPKDTSNIEAYEVRNTLQNIGIGIIVKERVGRFLHWTFRPQLDTYFTNGCLKEISDFMTKLYSKDKSKEDKQWYIINIKYK